MKAVNGGKSVELTVREVELAVAYEREIERINKESRAREIAAADILNLLIDELRKDNERLRKRVKELEGCK